MSERFSGDIEVTEKFPVQTLLPSRPGKRPLVSVIRDDLAEMKKKYAACPSDEARRALVKERRQVVSDAKAHAALCGAWAHAQTEDRSFELQQIRDERREAIVKKLVALGYEADIASIRYPLSLEDHEFVKKPQKLTELWANIREPILKFMGEVREVRLKRERAQLLLLRKPVAVDVFRVYMAKRHPYTDVMPSGLDFCDFPPVKAILEQPSEVTVNETAFGDIVPLIPAFIEKWRQSLDVHLLQLLKDKVEGKTALFDHISARFNKFGEFTGGLDHTYEECADADDNHHGFSNLIVSGSGQPSRKAKNSLNKTSLPDRLKLATTVFSCSNCRTKAVVTYSNPHSLYGPRALFYPKVKGHHCLTRVPPPGDSFFRPFTRESVLEEPARKLNGTDTRRKQWSTHPLNVNIVLGQCAETLVEKAGLDLKAATADDMDNLGLWFGCLCCAYNCGGKQKEQEECPYEMPAFTWRLAVRLAVGFKLIVLADYDKIKIDHYAVAHISRGEGAWTMIIPEQLDEAVEAFKRNPNSSHNKPEVFGESLPYPSEVLLPKDETWSCVSCRDTPSDITPTSLEAVKKHLVEKSTASNSVHMMITLNLD
ncbi:hypothetical protein C0991_007612 [Blastosporella zonata]|nr:hypothetical protein C0991_007612 [Blastosporella zonata]